LKLIQASSRPFPQGSRWRIDVTDRGHRNACSQPERKVFAQLKSYVSHCGFFFDTLLAPFSCGLLSGMGSNLSNLYTGGAGALSNILSGMGSNIAGLQGNLGNMLYGAYGLDDKRTLPRGDTIHRCLRKRLSCPIRSESTPRT
jgi:hypothetical protein